MQHFIVLLQTVTCVVAPSLVSLVQIPMTLGSFFILVRGAFCISANLTVNESIVGKKYPYLQTPDRQFWNFFDRGTLANCLQFWLVGNPRPDWALIYQREQEVLSLPCPCISADPCFVCLNGMACVILAKSNKLQLLTPA